MISNLVADAGVRKRLFILIVFFKCVESTVVPCRYTIEQEWDTGFLAKISIPIAERYNYGWVLYIKYDNPVVELDVFEAELVDGHPNNKEYVFKNVEYNYVIYHYKDKILNLYLQGNQYPSGDRAVYKSPPDAEVLFIPYLTPTESLQEALKRVDDLPEDQRRPKQITTSTTATSVITTTLPPLSISSTTTTTRLPWMGWRTPAINILASTSTTTSSVLTTEQSLSVIQQYIPATMKFVLNLFAMAVVLSTSLALEVDVLFEDRGCAPLENFPELQSFEGKDPLLIEPYRIREKPIQKCARVASKYGFKFFAVKNGGMCFTGPLARFRFGHHWPCRKEYVRLYEVNIITDAKYAPLGCKKLEYEREDWFELSYLFPDWPAERSWSNREEALEKCARSAAIAGFRIFGFRRNQEGHMCSGLRRNWDEIRRLPRDFNCSLPGDSPRKGISGHTPELFQLKQISNISLFNMGCWKRDPVNHAFPLLESRSDILGDMHYKARPDAISRCAVYNADRGHEFIAITDGGACAGSRLRRPSYEDAGRSAKCSIDGRGAKNADQVYKIVRESLDFEVELRDTSIPFHLTPMGCWRVGLQNPIPTLEGTGELLDNPELRMNPIQRCAMVAHKQGFEVIAIREGRCFSAKNARERFSVYGNSDECRTGLGGPESMSVFEINVVRDPWFNNEGCFERCEPLDMLEGKHPLLEDDVMERLDPIRKCAFVASLWNYDSFGLLNGGLCYGLFWSAVRNCIRSASCIDEGLGGRFAHQIYTINEQNNMTLQNLGCWKDDAFRNIPIAEGASLELSGRFTERDDMIGACARYARSRGFQVFAVQAGGMCLTSEKAQEHYWRFGWSDKCLEDGKGGPWANQVWRIYDGDWWESPIALTKIPKTWRQLGQWNCTWEWWKTPTFSQNL